jgi:hypothetical protein
MKGVLVMKQVTEKEFFEVIGKLDVTCTPKGNYPYRTDFCYRNGERVGYVQDIDIIGLPISKYYICDKE